MKGLEAGPGGSSQQLAGLQSPEGRMRLPGLTRHAYDQGSSGPQ